MFDTLKHKSLETVAGWMGYDIQEQTASAQNQGQWLVPANASLSQILDYMNGTGDLWPLELYQVGMPFSKNTALNYATFSRCVELVSAGMSSIIANGRILVIDQKMQRRDKSRKSEYAIELISGFGGTETTTRQLLEDCGADYCIDGNALIRIHRDEQGKPIRLEQYRASDADIHVSTDGTHVYEMSPAHGDNTGRESEAGRNVVHARFPFNRSFTTRQWFASSPVISLRPALEIGLASDNYIRGWFRKGLKSNVHIDFARNAGEKKLTTEQEKQVIDNIKKYTNSPYPLVTFGAKATKIDDQPINKDSAELRDFQVAEIGRYYGVPSTLLNVNITQWGAGIESLAKLWYRFGLAYHTQRFLDALAYRLLDPGKQFFVDSNDMLRGDADAISNMIWALDGDAQRAPKATREEIRRIGGLEPMPPEQEIPWPAREMQEKRNQTDGNEHNRQTNQPRRKSGDIDIDKRQQKR